MSVLFYRSVLDNSISPQEEMALYVMGGLMQFGNDIFDIYKDCQQRIDTLITTAGKVEETRQEFSQMMGNSFSTVYETSYHPKNIRKFLRLFSMCLCARCFVFLDQLEAKEKTSNNKFTPFSYGREDLICDMDKARNKFRTISHFIFANT